ncbi:TPA: hypothetical protein EYO12_01565 [Candidatus Saccharibacteria bacterium]|nr:hypothetical protein [Candidatus Saccharibacteria bacterium]HIO87404.1 hypothetical protein [Candidatus Saccharibacteria bacterium]
MAEPLTSKRKQQELKVELEKRINERDDTLPELVSALSKVSDTSTRDEIAKQSVKYFFVILTLLIVGIPTYNAAVSGDSNFDSLRLSLPDLMQQYGSILGPVLGFVIGYYFKSKD